jgi:hypothetical protein
MLPPLIGLAKLELHVVSKIEMQVVELLRLGGLSS